jgi:hypothetical protein
VKSIHDGGQASRFMKLPRPHRFAKRGRARAHRRRQCQTLGDRQVLKIINGGWFM